MTDEARESLQKGTLSPMMMETVSDILEALIFEESTPRAAEFDIILKSHLDKLLEDLITAPPSHSNPGRNVFTDLVSKAKCLHNRWLKRFQSRYLHIDDVRMRKLQEDGALHDFALACDLKEVGYFYQNERTCPSQNRDREGATEHCYQTGQ